jgi:hypothetical protein
VLAEALAGLPDLEIRVSKVVVEPADLELLLEELFPHRLTASWPHEQSVPTVEASKIIS